MRARQPQLFLGGSPFDVKVRQRLVCQLRGKPADNGCGVLTHMAGPRLEFGSDERASPRAEWAPGHYPPPAGWMNALSPSA
jgi:hypothetical protein